MTPFVLLALLLAPQDRPAEKCTLSGTVVNFATGEPLNKVLVRLEPVGSELSVAAYAMTDARGQFTLPNLDAGHYRIKGKRNGYLDTYYGARRAESKGTVVTVEPGQTIGELQLKLLPFGVIAGTVRDGDGEALVKATVTVFRLHYDDGRRKLTNAGGGYTDDLGQFRIPGLAPGKYYVEADPDQKPLTSFTSWGATINIEGGVFITEPNGQPRKPARLPEVMLPALAPGVRDLSGARVVDLDAGARVIGADVVLPRSPTVTVKGRATGPPGMAISSVKLEHGDPREGPLYQSFDTGVEHDGNFAFDAVPGGLYSLSGNVTVEAHPAVLTQVEGQDLSVSFSSPDAAACHEHIPVQVGQANVEGVRLAVTGGGEVEGRVTAEGKDKPESLNGQIEFEDANGKLTTADVDPAGAFKMQLCPGHYSVTVNVGPEALLVHSLRSASRDVMAEGLTIGGPGKEPLDVVLAVEGGKLDGTVLDADEKPVAGATVVLVPEAKLRGRPRRFHQTETDQYGHYEFANVPPGDYSVFAWEDIELGIWWDAEFLRSVESKGQPVTIPPNRHETSKLHVIR